MYNSILEELIWSLMMLQNVYDSKYFDQDNVMSSLWQVQIPQDWFSFLSEKQKK